MTEIIDAGKAMVTGLGGEEAVAKRRVAQALAAVKQELRRDETAGGLVSGGKMVVSRDPDEPYLVHEVDVVVTGLS